MKKMMLMFLGLATISSFAEAAPVCKVGMLPVYVCAAKPTDDGIYRFFMVDIVICNGKDGSEAVLAHKNTEPEYLPAVKSTKADKIIYTMFEPESQTSFGVLKINSTNLEKSTFRFAGDDVSQKRICRKTR